MLEEYVKFLNENVTRLNNRSVVTLNFIFKAVQIFNFGFSYMTPEILKSTLIYIFNNHPEKQFKEFVYLNGSIAIYFEDDMFYIKIPTDSNYRIFNLHTENAVKGINYSSELKYELIEKIQKRLELNIAFNKKVIGKLKSLDLLSDQLDQPEYFITMFNLMSRTKEFKYEWFEELLTEELIESNLDGLDLETFQRLTRYQEIENELGSHLKSRALFLVLYFRMDIPEVCSIGLSNEQLKHLKYIAGN